MDLREVQLVARRKLDTLSGEIDSDSLCTPHEIADPLYELWPGGIACDPCSNQHSIIRAKETYTFGGLHRAYGVTTYQNHPYSTNEPWIDKANHEMQIGHVVELVILCMTATSTLWWKKAMVVPQRNPRVICTPRLKFLGPSGKPMVHGARFDTSLIYYGRHHRRFDKLFAHVANWTTWGR